MRRFILVDHSITGLAGHHYEYSMHVLRAVRQAGYEPVLVTNRKFRESDVPWRVLPLYEFGFWPEPVSSSWKFVRKLFSGLVSRSFSWRFRIRYSELGLAWESRHNWSMYLARRRGEGAPLVVRSVAVISIVIFEVARVFLVAILLPPFFIAGTIVWSLLAGARFLVALARALLAGRKPVTHQPVRSFLKGLAAVARRLVDLPSFARHCIAQIGSMSTRRQPDRTHQTRAFGRDTGRMLQTLAPGAGDILFFPTISEHDLSGLAGHLDRTGEGLEASWHFLFRRNIYSATRAEYAAQDEGMEELRSVFERVQQSELASCSFFYTDTAELTEQYDRLGVFHFHTLPVPHTYNATDLVLHSGPLRLTYLGDARTEKGFPLLPDLAADLGNEYLATGKARLVVQCNYNIPGGEPKVAVARGQLEGMSARHVELYKNPLTSEEYQRLLLTSDISLLCYDPANYYARSSGILVESLAAGIPVIVPSGCWLARQFLAPYIQHIESLRNQMMVLGSKNMSELKWRDEKNERARPSGGGLLRLQSDAGAYVFLDVPHGATHVLLRGLFALGTQRALASICEVGWQNQPARDARKFHMEAADGQNRTALCADLLPNVAKVWIRLSTLHAAEKAWLSSLDIDFLRASDRCRVPGGAVGLMYSSTEEIPGLVRDLIDHYPHYRRTAVEFSESWRAYHNSDRLLREMEAVAGLVRADVPSVHARVEGVAV